MGNSIKEKKLEVEVVAKKKIDVEFDFREMIQFKSKPIEEDYKLAEVINRGNNSTVYRAFLKKGGLERAVKVIKKKNQGDVLSSSVINEVFILKSLDHPNVSKCFDVYENPKSYYVVSEYLSGGKLFDRIIEKVYFSQTDICIYFQDVLRIVRYLHSKNIMHRDIRPENLIFSDRENSSCLKIIDFSTAIQFQSSEPQERPRIGHAHYMAPEMVGKKYNEKCDIWSAGVILYIMLSGEPPFNGKDENQIMTKISTRSLKFDKPKWRNISDNAKDLVSKLLNPNPSQRLCAEKAMCHPWFERGKGKTGKESYLRDTLSNMKKFYSLKKMQQGILVFMVNFLSSNSERDSLMKAFKMVDQDGDGRISLSQLQMSYQKVQGLPVQKAERMAKKIFQEVDKNKSGYIDYSEFLISSMNISSSLTDQKLESAFRMLDQDGDGALNLDELKNVLGPNIPTNIYGLIVEEFDENKNGLISKEEFVAMMKSISLKL